MKRQLTYLFTICLTFLMVKSWAQDVIQYVHNDSIFLTWQPMTNASGYFIKNGETEIAQTKRLVDNDEIRRTIGPKTELYLKMAGLDSEKSDFTEQAYRELKNDEEAFSFFLAVCATDPGMLQALGTYVVLSLTSELSNLSIQGFNSLKTVESYNISVRRTKSVIGAPVKAAGLSNEDNVRLTWDVPDEFSIVKTNIYRSKNRLGTYTNINLGINLFSFEEGYADTYLEDGTYFYYLKHLNVFGFEGTRSDILEVKVKNNQLKKIEGLIAKETTSGQIKLEWNSTKGQTYLVHKSSLNEFVAAYPPSQRIAFKDNYYYDTKVTEVAEYQYFIPLNIDANTAITSDTVTISLTDKTAPNPPTGVEGSVSKLGIVTIVWNENKEKDILGYEIERYTGDSGVNNFLLTPEHLLTNRYSESLGGKSEAAYRYQIFAIDESYNRSGG